MRIIIPNLDTRDEYALAQVSYITTTDFDNIRSVKVGISELYGKKLIPLYCENREKAGIFLNFDFKGVFRRLKIIVSEYIRMKLNTAKKCLKMRKTKHFIGGVKK